MAMVYMGTVKLTGQCNIQLFVCFQLKKHVFVCLFLYIIVEQWRRGRVHQV